MIRKTVQILITSLTLLIVLFFTFFQRVEHKFIHPSKFTINNNPNLDSTLFVGFNKQSIVPDKPVKIAGYGLKREEFKEVHDSIFVKSVYLKNKYTEAVILTYDLLLVAPIIASKVENELRKIGIDNVYFSASHTHSSIGGYGNSLIGNLILGGHSEDVINTVVNQTIKSVIISKKSTIEVLNIVVENKKFNKVKNRVTNNRNFEQNFRSIYLNTIDDEQVRLMSANVHPTIIGHDVVKLSNDYPGMLCKQSKSVFNMFLAGTMGNVSPIIHKGENGFERASLYSKYLLSSKIIERDTLRPSKLMFQKINFQTPKLGMFATENIRMRSWIFNLLFDQANSYVNILFVDNLLMIGLPVELSADYYAELDLLAESKGLKLVLTTFNGAYLGYAPPSEFFYINHRETRETNWLGKYSGDYFAEVIRMIIENK